MKRGQITLYVIIAAAIVFAALITVYIQRNSIMANVGYVNPEIRPIKTYVEDCLEKTTENGLYLIGMQGGYISLPSNVFETNFSTIAYGYYKKNNMLISLQGIEGQLDNYIGLMLPQCVDFSKWPDFSISGDAVKSTVQITENEVIADVTWPLTLEKSSTYRLDKFSVKLPVRFDLIHSIAREIVNKTLKAPDHIDVAYLVQIYGDYNISVDLVPYNETFVYSITDPQSIVLNRSYSFFIAAKP